MKDKYVREGKKYHKFELDLDKLNSKEKGVISKCDNCGLLRRKEMMEGNVNGNLLGSKGGPEVKRGMVVGKWIWKYKKEEDKEWNTGCPTCE